MKFDNIRIRFKLQLLFLLTGIVPLVVVGVLFSNWVEKSLIEEASNKLISIQSIRKGQIENYFHKSLADIQYLASSPDVVKSLGDFADHKQEKGAGTQDSLRNTTISSQVVISLNNYLALYDYQDIYLVDAAHGHIFFNINSPESLGINLSDSQYRKTALSETWKKALDTGKAVISDFEPYAHSNNEEVVFIAQPVFDQHDHKIGVVIIRFNSTVVSTIVESTVGMGETGESYLLGWLEQKDKFELRSDVKTMGAGKYVVGFDLGGKKLNYWIDAVEHGTGGGCSVYIDSAGNEVLVAYNQMRIEGLEWYLISKIDKYEITKPIRDILIKFVLVVFLLFLIIFLVAWLLSSSFTNPILAEKDFADEISNGKLDAKLEVNRRDELGDLAISLNNMSVKLQENDWMKSGKESLDNDLRGDLPPDELANRAISFFVKHTNAAFGAIYLNKSGMLELRASYAFSDRKGNFSSFEFGEGLVGQAALENELLFFSHVKDDAPVINYGAGEDIPEYFVAAPCVIDGDVVAVMLLGSIQKFSSLEKLFIEQSCANLAIILNAAKSRMRISVLLKEAQQQHQQLEKFNSELESQTKALKASELDLLTQQEELRITNEELEEQTRSLKESEAELQAQQEELRVTNEELEEQTGALTASEAELQAQQEELRVANEELQERTEALEEQKREVSGKNMELEDAQKIVETKVEQLEISGKYKTEFLANMSHELRTPLNSILILSQLLSSNKKHNLTDKQVESASAIHSSGADLLNLINEILDLSKVEAGKVDLYFEEFPFNRIEADLQRLYQDLAQEKGIGFEVVQDTNLPQMMRTDSQRLQQILRNLVSNAFKFTSEGTVSLDISCPPEGKLIGTNLEGQKSIKFAVKDDGIGIPAEQQENIFQAFRQADGSTSRKYGGTGLGLSISKELSKLLGGFITIESTKGKGSTFSVFLPLSSLEHEATTAQYNASEDRKQSLVAPVKEEGSTIVQEKNNDPVVNMSEQGDVEDDRKIINESSKSLLIIEDDSQFAKVLRDIGRERGFECIIARDGESGLHFADFYTPSAIMLDIGLPGIDGWTVMERLKENSKLRHIPVHFMSASDSSMDAMRMGAVGYLTKPVSLERVEETLSKLENVISRPVKRLLLVEDDDIQRNSINELIGNSDVKTTAVDSGAKALHELASENYDCMILDLGLGDMTGFELLEKIGQSDDIYRLPIIIYTGRELTEKEEAQLKKYSETIIIKGAKSPERLLDESALFLHRVEANLPEDKRQMLKLVHDQESVLSDRKILLVDDDMRNVFALSSILEEKGLDITVARDGIECLEKLKKNNNFDAVLMDIMMPRMDGYETMREIRKDNKYRKLPIIALTAKAMKGDRSKCIEAGASDYLAKPVDSDQLISMLRVWLY
ncbi:MAG: response regulator [Desulfotalea sp.]